jgi:hypothetical protein
MPDKHKISDKTAKELIDRMKNEKAAASSPFNEIPEGFSFELNEVKRLIAHPNAKYFVIQFGWELKGQGKNKKANLTPILCIADKNYKIIPDTKSDQLIQSATMEKSSMENASFDDDDKEAGGFLEEADPFPPPGSTNNP